MDSIFAEGDLALFIDDKGREAYGVLTPGKRTSLRGDHVPHDRVIGAPLGIRMSSRRHRVVRVLPATLRDHIENMPKHAAIIQPKDAAAIVLYADVFPGAKVVEGGFGSGALSLCLLRAVGATGSLSTYENREEAANRGRKNVVAFTDATNHTVHVADIYEGISETEVDRVVLDVPEPWQVLGPAREALVRGGVLAAYVPTILQVQRFVLSMQKGKVWTKIESMEILHRGWYITPESVRPEHRMVGHTGFLVFARRGAEEDLD